MGRPAFAERALQREGLELCAAFLVHLGLARLLGPENRSLYMGLCVFVCARILLLLCLKGSQKGKRNVGGLLMLTLHIPICPSLGGVKHRLLGPGKGEEKYRELRAMVLQATCPCAPNVMVHGP